MDSLKTALVDSPVLAFPRYELQFRLAVDTSSDGIGYMLYQVWPEKEFPANTPERDRTRIIRFGSRSLKKWQASYGPTKLELLGLVTGILDCASYLRGQKFLVQCDHQALKPLFQNKMKGKLYERWLAILQQFNFQIHYLPGGQMAVPDALSRCNPEASPQSSPEETDAFFPYVQEPPTGDIELPGGVQLRDLIGSSQGCNHLNVDDGYDADTDDFDICPVPVTSPQAANGLASGPSVGAINESTEPDRDLPEATPEPELDATALRNRTPITSSGLHISARDHC